MVGLTIAHIESLGALMVPASTLLAGCALAFSITTLWVLHHRRRKVPDLTLNFWRLAMISLVLVSIVWAISRLLAFDMPALLLGILMIHSFAMTTVNGMMYKIIPFIIWLHLSARNKTLRDEGKRELQVKVPHMRKIIPEAAGLRQFRFHFISLILLAMATIWPQWLYYPAAVLFAVSQAILLFNLSNAARFYYAKATELSAVT